MLMLGQIYALTDEELRPLGEKLCNRFSSFRGFKASGFLFARSTSDFYDWMGCISKGKKKT